MLHLNPLMQNSSKQEPSRAVRRCRDEKNCKMNTFQCFSLVVAKNVLCLFYQPWITPHGCSYVHGKHPYTMTCAADFLSLVVSPPALHAVSRLHFCLGAASDHFHRHSEVASYQHLCTILADCPRCCFSIEAVGHWIAAHDCYSAWISLAHWKTCLWYVDPRLAGTGHRFELHTWDSNQIKFVRCINIGCLKRIKKFLCFTFFVNWSRLSPLSSLI